MQLGALDILKPENAEQEFDTKTYACRQMYAALMERAILDFYGGRTNIEQKDQRNAEAWIFRNTGQKGERFSDVCKYLDLDPITLKDLIREKKVEFNY